MQYAEIRIELPKARAEDLSAWLGEQGLGFQEADETTLDPPPPGRVRFHLYVQPEQSEGVIAGVRGAVAAPSDVAVSVLARDEDEWRDAWKRYFTTRRFGRLALVPSWEAAAHRPEPGEVALQIDPGRAFGTGGHASTRLCLGLIDQLAVAGPLGETLDVGCGSGVLGIAALLCDPGARGVAIDIDPESLEVTGENAAINGVADRLRTAGTALAAVEQTFALVLANLSGPTLHQLADGLAARVRPGGKLVLSGILTSESAGVAARFEALGLQQLDHQREEEWSALLLQRGPGDRRGA